MKKIIFYLFIASFFVQCSKDETITVDEDAQDLQYEQLSLDLSKAIPNPSLDNSSKGLYVGTLATTDLRFHEKVFVNIENDGNINAQIITPDTKHVFQGLQSRRKENVYQFTGKIGSFTVLLGQDEATITNATFYNLEAVVNVYKSTSANRGIPSLGGFTSSDGSIGGTWDFLWQSSGPESYIATGLTIVKNGGSSFSLPVSGVSYNRICIPMIDPIDPIGPDVYDIIFSVSAAGSTQLLNEQLNFNVTGSSFIPFSLTCESTPTSLPLSNNTWNWNGMNGTVTLDYFSLPSF